MVARPSLPSEALLVGDKGGEKVSEEEESQSDDEAEEEREGDSAQRSTRKSRIRRACCALRGMW